MCTLDQPSGQHLSESDVLLVMDTCGAGEHHVPRLAARLGFALSSSMNLASFGSTALSGAGGQYRLCWCTGTDSNSTSADGGNLSSQVLCGRARLPVDFGQLTVVGASTSIWHVHALSVRMFSSYFMVICH